MTTDRTTALDAATAALDEALARYYWPVTGSAAERILSDPKLRRALLAVLLDTDTVAAARHATSQSPHREHPFSECPDPKVVSDYLADAPGLIAALTKEPTDAE